MLLYNVQQMNNISSFSINKYFIKQNAYLMHGSGYIFKYTQRLIQNLRLLGLCFNPCAMTPPLH